MVIFGDEVGTDVCQEEDGHIGGQTYVVPVGTRAEIKSSNKSSRWTTIGLTAATGEPVMCIIIFSGKEYDVLTRLGYDVRAKEPFDPKKPFSEQVGPGKAFSKPPTCLFQGKEVPALVTSTPTGSITSNILKSALKRLDDLNVYERKEGRPIPCLLLDAHDSRLQLPVLQYVNEKVKYGPIERPRWRLCIGLPNATHDWQVGDSEEQNGNWKTSTTREKDAVINWKTRHNFPPVIEQYDIIPIVNAAWEDSFADIEQNLKAIRARGWNPLNQALLKRPDMIRKSKTISLSASATQQDVSNNDDISPASFDSFNFEDGLAGKFTSDFLQFVSRKDTIINKSKERYEKAKLEKGRLDYAKKLSGGNMFKAGHIVCDDEVLRMREYKEAKKTESRSTVIMNAIKTYHKYFDEYTQLTQSGKSTESYGGKEHAIVIRMLKQKSDGAMPKSAGKKKEEYMKMKDRAVPTLDQYLLERGYPREEFEPIQQQMQQQAFQDQMDVAEDEMLDGGGAGIGDDMDNDDDDYYPVCSADDVEVPLPPLPLPDSVDTNNLEQNDTDVGRGRRGAAVRARERVATAIASGGIEQNVDV